MGDGLTTLLCPRCNEEISVELATGASIYGCPICGGEFQIEDPGATKEIARGEVAASVESAKPPQVPLHRPAKRLSGGAIALVTMLIVGGGVTIYAIFASQVPVGEPVAQSQQGEWTIANQSGYTIDGVTVRVQSVQIGPVRAKNSDGTAFVSDRQDYWTVKLRIRNGSENSIEYRTWHTADFPGDNLRSAIMKDDTGKRFVMQQFEDVSVIQEQTLKKTLSPRESTIDVIVFEAPDGIDKEKLKELRLELPGAACQVKGVFRQIIPKSLIEE
jgi:hypothetical protein